ncbi:acyltransferase family protein [Priestia aryabhattai]|uniref:acyltransferase family protein n=1 Tax=Priestia aryabhattai TaxID=412384 RepID=UPI001CCB6110|nr:acyltransferase [Priestia aryabhattai]MBZ6489022.1 acyltransferase [Priestia aryabhattai]
MKRLEELDSMRGIAALTVLIWHTMLILFTAVPAIALYSPIYFVMSGDEAVIFFFVLSGFVMSLPFYYGSIVSYTNYLVKRFFRIYVPYLVTIIITFLLSTFFINEKVSDLSPWFNGKWFNHFNSHDIFSHVLLIGNFSTTEYNPVIWSLVQEMRISIIFPVIMIFIIKYGWKVNLGIGFILYGIAQLNEIFRFQRSIGFHTSFFETLHYTFIFIIGALIAKNRGILINWYNKRPGFYKVIIISVAFFSYTYSRLVGPIMNKLGFTTIVHFAYSIKDIGVTLGAILFIIIILSNKKQAKIFSNELLVLNGKLSYSLYLYHVPVLLVTFHLFYNLIPIWFLLLVSFTLTFFISFISYRFVELPSINLAKVITRNKSLHKGHKKAAS